MSDNMHDGTTEAQRVGATLRAMRTGAGMSVRELAKAADLSPSHLYRIERGQRALFADHRHAIARGIACRLAARMAGSGATR